MKGMWQEVESEPEAPRTHSAEKGTVDWTHTLGLSVYTFGSHAGGQAGGNLGEEASLVAAAAEDEGPWLS